MRLDLWRRWQNQVVVWLMLIAILAVVAVAVRTFLDYRAAAIDLLIARDQKLTYLSAARLRDELSKFVDALVSLSRAQAVYAGEPDAQRQALRQAPLVQEGLFDGGIVLLDNFGRVIASEPNSRDIVGQDWSDREFFRRMLSSTSVYFSDVLDDPSTGAKVVIISVPVIGDGGEFAGVLSGTLRLGESVISPLYATIVRLRVGQEGGNIYVLDRRGTVLFDSSSERVGQRHDNASLSEIMANRQPGALRTLDSNGELVIASFAPVPGTDWVLLVEDNWGVVTAETQRYLRLLIVLLVLGILLLVFGTGWLIRRLHNEEAADEFIENPTQVAMQLRQMLLPDTLPTLPGWKIAVHYQLHPAVEGDFYDFILLHDGRLMLTLGNVNASGIPVTGMIAMARTLLRGAARSMLPPVQALEHSNDLLCPDLPSEQLVTCVFALIDPSTGHVQFANAGYHPPFHRNHEKVEPFEVIGIPLGAQLGTTYIGTETTLAPGDSLVFCNRGLIDMQNEQGETFGSARLQKVIKESIDRGEELIDEILTALQNFIGDSEKVSHAVVLVILERKAAPGAG